MAENDPGQQHPSDGGAGAEAKPSRKFAGKFESPEAVEDGYLALERQFHEVSQRNAELEAWVGANTKDVGAGDDRREDSYRNADTTRFFTDPEGTLRERDEKLSRQVLQQALTVQQVQQSIFGFLNKNPDLQGVQPMLAEELKKTPRNLSTDERLEMAAQKTRTWMNGLVARSSDEGDRGGAPRPGEHVEGAAGGDPRPRNNSPQSQKPPSEESELNDYIAVRRAQRARLAGRGNPT